ncbi:SDR family NAD(P)-dependent oxidoreductase [Lysinibacillus sp. NPDC092081]|uniref:SDR family NAD(P)-dependent oxidoreductase n=1 Tax=Lysinibacillus sp. NPDC092081 TaxID=3364131 RepID=UPI003824A3B4
MNSKEILYALKTGQITPKKAKQLLEISTVNITSELTSVTDVVKPGSSPQKVVEVHELEPGIVQLTMQDHIHKNTLTERLIEELTQAFESIQSNPNYKVVILTGYDNYFATGGTKEGLLAIYEGKIKCTDTNIYNLALNCKIPVIAAIQGHAIGAGWCMGMFCDFIVMSKESVYTANFMQYGFTPGAGATLIFPEKLGISLAQEILFTGKEYRGAELVERGVSFPILSRKEVLPYAIELARMLSKTPRNSLIALKQHMSESTKIKLLDIAEKEMKMHETTFVNQEEVRERIETLFDHSSGSNKFIKEKLLPLDKDEINKSTFIPNSHSSQDSIAIIGMSGQFPKSKTLDEFWDNQVQGKDCISEIPAMRWSEEFYNANPKAPGKTYSKWMGVLEDIDKFDPLFFNISPAEAELMDPQQRLFLENCWSSIEDAGLSPSSLSGSRCGVFVGCSNGDYVQSLGEKGLNAQGLMGGSLSILAARISYFLNLKGPSLALDTACSSSLVAIAEACNSLILGTSDLALAGGVCVITNPSLHIMASKAGMLSSDGRCFTFDDRANGFVPGEGVGVLLLKRLSDAIRDKDNIYGVIRGWGVNQDGKTNGITAPSVNSQVCLEKEVFEKFNINPETISLVEAHGTGTKLGDPIEVEALTESFRSFTQKKEYCALGSVKSSIGHLLAAAGVAGAIKVLLAMKHKMIPPMIHFDKLNEHIFLENSPFYINSELRPWETEHISRPLRASVSSFGFSGTNAHLVIEEYISENSIPKTTKLVDDNNPILFVLSAKTKEQLHVYAETMSSFIESHTDVDLINLAYTLQVGRDAMEHRLAFVADSRDTLMKKLKGFKENNLSTEVLTGQVIRNKKVNSFEDHRENLVDTYIQEKKLQELAECWVSGLKIEWENLYYNMEICRIHLPSYPFAREKYWIDNIKHTVSPCIVGIRNGNWKSLHPLLDANISTIEETRFNKELNGNEFFLVDHQLGGSKVLPGAAYLEMVRAAGELLSNRSVRILSDVIWISPVIVNDDPLELFIGLHPNSQHMNYKVYSIKGTEKIIHSYGQFSFETTPIPNQLDPSIDEIKKRCPTKRDKIEIYKAFQDMGFNYGPSFQVTEEVFVGAGEVLARLSLPEEYRESSSEFILHPALVDGALRTIMSLAVEEIGMKPELGVPFAMDSMEILKPIANDCYAHATISKDENQNSKFNITILNEDGELLVRISNLVVRKFSQSPAYLHANDVDKAMLFFQPVWEKAPLLARNTLSKVEGVKSLIIFDTEDSVKEEVQSSLITKISSKETVILVIPGESYQKINSAKYRINPCNARDYELLFSDLKNSGRVPSHLLHLWNYKTENFDIWDDNYLRDANVRLGNTFDKGLYSLIYLFQSITKLTPELSTTCLFVFPEGYRLPQCEVVADFAKSLTMINHRFNLKTVQVDKKHPLLYASLLKELLSKENASGSEIRYRNDERFVRVIKPVEVTDSVCNSVSLKTKGVYLITGGCGGLGMIFASYLAENYKAKIILTGRSELTPEIIKKIEKLKELGGEALYCKADVSKFDEVKETMQTIHNKFGDLDGVFHSAGGVDQTSILEADKELFDYALGAKVYGTINLDLATQHENLDFFIFFSSLSSVVGDFGSGSYATGNGFMDRYAVFREQLYQEGRRKGKTISINWPLWKEGGMQLPENEESAFYFDYSGMGAIDTKLGLKAFEIALTTGLSQVVLAYGDAEKINRVLGINQMDKQLDSQNGRKGNLPIDTPVSKLQYEETMLLKTEKYLQKLFASIIKLPEERINTQIAFEQYGINSIVIMEINSRLEKDFPSLSKTLLFEYESLHELARYFVNNHSKQLEKIFSMFESEEENKSTYITNEKFDEVRNSTLSHSSKIQSHLIINEEKTNQENSGDIAIIGLSGRYPMANNLEEMWENLKQGKDCISEIPTERWDYRRYYNSSKDAEGRIYSKWGGFVADADKFDPLFFSISPREAEGMDPQERIFLETTWETVEDAGYTREMLNKSKVGVFVGVMYGTYSFHGAEELAKGNTVMAGASFSSIANRVSYFMNFNGPSLAIDTACSSSLEAIRQACENIRMGNCELAIAGGVNLTLHPYKYLLLCDSGFLSTDGRCRSFGEGGDGYVPGEGVGAVLLKPLNKAIEDGDHIYGVIKEFSSNHGGKTNGYTVPNPKAQSELIKEAIEKSKIDPRTISYIEAHGTGTALGDPIEIAGLCKAFETYTQDKQFCSIGSVKSNIGHLESASGIASLTKVLLQLKYNQLVPSLHSKILNPNIIFETTPFNVQQGLAEWKRPIINGQEVLRRAGISSFGAGGTNVHLLVEEYKYEQQVFNSPQNPTIIVLSAKNKERLLKKVEQLLAAIRKQQLCDTNLPDMAYTLQVGREAMEERFALIVESIKELEENLEKFLKGQDDIAGLFQGKVQDTNNYLSDFGKTEHRQKQIEVWIEKDDFERIVHEWLKGTEIDWNKLYGKETPCLISLPTYPFEKERYWISNTEVKTDPVRIASSLHPLLHQNTSDFSEQRFSSLFTGQEFFLRDHVVKGRKILPGVAYLEMAREAIELATGSENSKTSVQIKNVVWTRAIDVTDQPTDVHIRLLPDENQEIFYEIYSDCECENKDLVVHSQGTAMLSSIEGVQSLDLEAIYGEFIESSIAPSELYELFKKIGIDYGLTHRGIKKLYVKPGKALAKLSLSSSISDTLDQFILHPALLDSAFHATICLLLETGDLQTSMPYALEEVEILGRCTSEMWAFIRSNSDSKNGEVLKFDIELCDEKGNIQVRIKGLSSRVVTDVGRIKGEKNTSISNTVNEPLVGPIKLTPVWDVFSAEKDTIDYNPLQSVVMIGGTIENTHAVQDLYPKVNRLDIHSTDSIDVITEKLKAQDTINHILWVAPHRNLTNLRDDSLINGQQKGSLQIFRIIKALLCLGYGDKNLEWTVITTKSQPIFPGETINPIHASIHGLIGTMAKEYPHWRVRLIDLEDDREWPVNEIFALPPDLEGNASVYRNAQWHKQQLVPLQCPSSNKTLYRKGGVYVVIGGAGGIGEAWSEYMIRTYQAQIIWIGRRPINTDIQAKIDRLETLGSTPLYITADATNRESLQRAYEKIKEHYSHIHGVIHSAIVLRDQSLMKMEEEHFQEALTAKVNVSVRLAQIFRGEPLDFVLFFSSINSFSKFPGQSNYAAGCTFKDAFAHQLAIEWPCIVKVMNWGYWGSLGIVSSEVYQERMAQLGIGSIEPPEAMDALESLLAGTVDQMALTNLTQPMKGINYEESVVVYPEDIPLSVKYIERHFPNIVKEQSSSSPICLSNGNNTDELESKVKLLLKQTVSQLFQVPSEDLDNNISLYDYGLDKYNVTEFVTKLNEEYNLELTPMTIVEYCTLNSLGKYLLKEYKGRIQDALHIIN